MSKPKEQIVFLTPGFAKSEQDSTNIPALQVFLKGLRHKLPEAKLTVITFQYPHTAQIYNWFGIEVIPLNGQSKKAKKLQTWHKAKKTLQMIHTVEKITAIHSFWIGECARIGERFAKKCNIKHVITVMGQDAIIKNSFSKYLKGKTTDIVTLSHNQQKHLLKTYNAPSIIIPWSIEIDNFPELKERTIDILGVGSLNKTKNYLAFIDVIFEIQKIHKTIRVGIIGDGEMATLLREKIKQLSLQNTITLYGKLDRTLVLEKMSQSKILLHTSSYESFGFVFLEALYSGMHIVSFDVGMAEKSNYWSVCKSEDELILACQDFITLKLNFNRRHNVSLDATLEAYLSLYRA